MNAPPTLEGAAAPASLASAARGGLYRKYALYLVLAVSVALLASGTTEIYFSQRELRAQLASLQQAKAEGAADKIAEFIGRIGQQVEWIRNLPPDEDFAAMRLDAQRLLRQAPPISHIRFLDPAGRERLLVSRIELDRLGSGNDLSSGLAFRTAATGKPYFSAVYFANETEPYMTLAFPPIRRDGWTVVAEVNLKTVWNVVEPMRIGQLGYAYLVDGGGTLIAHPDVSLVLQKINLASLPQVATALSDTAGSAQASSPGIDLDGVPVLGAHAPVPGTDWTIFVEQPRSEADAPIYNAVLRTTGLLFGGLALALLVSLKLARRMVAPIAALKEGAEQLARGSLDHRIEVRSRDELESLAAQFNGMAARLQDSYTGLERKVAERTQELAIANRAKTRLLASASHDLRQPLHALGLLIAGMRQRKDPSRLHEMLERADLAIEMSSELLDSLLDISKLDAGVVQPVLAEVSVGSILEQVAFDFGSEAQDKGLSLRMVLSKAVVRTDAAMLSRILMNLVSNAIRHTDRGKVLVGCRRCSGRLRLEVWDTGRGIPADQQDAIFQEFYKLAARQGDADRGLGLGLSIVRRLADLLGGKLEVASVSGRGSRFAVTLPGRILAERDNSEPKPDQEIGISLRGRSILVIDDEAIVVDALAALLEAWGCSVLTAAGSEEALRLLHTAGNTVDLIICDNSLRSGTTGLAALDQLLAQSPRAVAGILMTGDTDADLLRRAKDAGYLTLHKPVRPAKLRSILNHLLAPAAEEAVAPRS